MKKTGKIEMTKKRTTIYLAGDVHRILKIKSAETARPISDLIEEAVWDEFSIDREDLAAFEERRLESTISYENMLEELKRDGKI